MLHCTMLEHTISYTFLYYDMLQYYYYYCNYGYCNCYNDIVLCKAASGWPPDPSKYIHIYIYIYTYTFVHYYIT